jgi:signal transduction histidine kinase
MPKYFDASAQRERPGAAFIKRRARSVGVTAAVGFVYFLIAELGLGLYGQTNWVSVFWPAFGVSAGILIGLGPGARLQVATGIIVAILVAHFRAGDPSWLGPAFALSDAAEALVAAGLIQYLFGADFSLSRLNHVLGLLAAAILGSLASFAVWILPSTMFQDSKEPILITFQHWFMGDIVGFVALGPFVIGLFAAVRQRPSRDELIEGAAALAGLALMTAIIILLPKGAWETLVPVAWLFPMLFWLAARCRPFFAAAGACMVSITVVWTTVFGIGHFGDSGLPVDARNLQAQVTILVVALGAFILAALFAERRESEARLGRSNMMLERERDNKLMNLEAMAASIAHEVRQPLATIVTMGSAASRFLGRTPPDLERVRSNLNTMVGESHRASQVFDNIRALFGRADKGSEPIDVNEIALEVLRILGGELKDRGITTRTELMSGLPLVMGHRGQLQEVLLNLVRNAIEAMDAIKDGSRVLQLRTQRHNHGEIVLAVEDTGPGIDSKKLEGIFDPFVSTKPQGMGLGLAICRMIIDRHGGQLSASSGKKRGAVFQFILPTQPATDQIVQTG